MTKQGINGRAVLKLSGTDSCIPGKAGAVYDELGMYQGNAGRFAVVPTPVKNGACLQAWGLSRAPSSQSLQPDPANVIAEVGKGRVLAEEIVG